MAEIIGVDVGYGNCKTVSDIYITSLRDYGETKPPLVNDSLYYNGKYYIVGGDRASVKLNRTDDDVAYILTLAGIAKELNHRNLPHDSHIVLAVGLPIDRCNGESKIELANYYKRYKNVSFSYEDEEYNITIDDVFVMAQGYAGVFDLISGKSMPDTCIVVDIGSWTIDILPIVGGKPQAAKAISLNDGIINCLLKCNEEIRRRTGEEVLESQIQSIMLGDKTILPAQYSNIIQEQIVSYIKHVADVLIEHKFNINTLPCVFIGGGSSVVKCYGESLFPIAKYRTDIHANAVGYETIAKQLIKMMSVQ